MIVKDAKMTAVYGRRGSGKTTLVIYLLSTVSRVIVFDPQDEYSGPNIGYERAGDLDAVLAAIKRGWRDGFRIAYVPVSGDEARQLHELSIFLWRVQAPYQEGRDHRKITLVIEEMDLSYPVTNLPAELNGMARLCNQGRHVGIELIGVTQHPHQISTTFRGNCAESYILPLGWAKHREPILGMIGREWADKLRDLADHKYLKFAKGKVSEGANQKRPEYI